MPQAEALYVSIDLDVLDSAVAPGHSLPEPGGLTYLGSCVPSWSKWRAGGA